MYKLLTKQMSAVDVEDAAVVDVAADNKPKAIPLPQPLAAGWAKNWQEGLIVTVSLKT